MNRKFSFKNTGVILPLYSSLIRPSFEYMEQCLSPYSANYIVKLEAVQRGAAKLISFLRNKSSKERLAELNLFSLEK